MERERIENYLEINNSYQITGVLWLFSKLVIVAE